jgi:hypothetical protein
MTHGCGKSIIVTYVSHNARKALARVQHQGICRRALALLRVLLCVVWEMCRVISVRGVLCLLLSAYDFIENDDPTQGQGLVDALHVPVRSPFLTILNIELIK